MFRHYDYDLIVIGTGAGGSTGAIYAARLGKRVAVVEKGKLGGDCPNYSCVPTKALLHAAETYDTVLGASAVGISCATTPRIDLKKVHAYKNRVQMRTGAAKEAALFEDENVEVIEGEARFVSPHEIRVGRRHYSSGRFLIATGAHVSVPPILGLEKTGYITYVEAGDMDRAPKSVTIIGGGLVGVEYAFIYSSLGIRVRLIEACDRIILSEDSEATGLIEEIMERRGIKLFLSSVIESVYEQDGKKCVVVRHGEKRVTIGSREILLATGMAPNVDLDLEKAGVAYDKRGIKVDDFLATSQPHIYAAGDVVGPLKLTATSFYQGHVAVTNMFSRRRTRANYAVVPRCLFVDPEFASVGVTEDELKQRNAAYKKGLAAMANVSRANSDNVREGFVKVLTRPDGTIIGAAIVSPRAGEMIHELALAMKVGAKAQDVAAMIHVYPSYCEAVKVACAMVA